MGWFNHQLVAPCFLFGHLWPQVFHVVTTLWGGWKGDPPSAARSWWPPRSADHPWGHNLKKLCKFTPKICVYGRDTTFLPFYPQTCPNYILCCLMCCSKKITILFFKYCKHLFWPTWNFGMCCAFRHVSPILGPVSGYHFPTATSNLDNWSIKPENLRRKGISWRIFFFVGSPQKRVPWAGDWSIWY